MLYTLSEWEVRHRWRRYRFVIQKGYAMKNTDCLTYGASSGRVIRLVKAEKYKKETLLKGHKATKNQ